MWRGSTVAERPLCHERKPGPLHLNRCRPRPKLISAAPSRTPTSLAAPTSEYAVSLQDDRVLTPLNLPYLRKFSNEEVSLDHSGENHLPYFGPHFRRALLAHLQLSPDCVIRLCTILPEDLGRTLHRCLPFDNPLTSVYLGAHESFVSDLNAFNDIKPECFSIMATDARRQRGVRIDFQMPGQRYPLVLATEPPKALIRNAPLLSAIEELWVVPAASPLLWEPDSLLAGFPHLTTLVLGLFPNALIPVITDGVETEDSEVAGCDPLSALEVRDDLVIPCPRLRTFCVHGFTERQAMLPYNVVLSRGEAGYPIRRFVVGFNEPPELTLLELVEGLWGPGRGLHASQTRGAVPGRSAPGVLPSVRLSRQL